jgi:hypothetical protein
MDLRKQLATRNDCYKAGGKLKPKGLMIHSTGANNPNLRRYVQPNDGLLGGNPYDNSFNTPQPGGSRRCVHAFIGKIASGAISTYQILPWDMEAWHCGGSANKTHLSVEICEDGLKDKGYFNKVYKEATEFAAFQCKLHGFEPVKPWLIDHSEAHDLGLASNHADVMHWFPKHGKSMDTFRADVKKLLDAEKPQPAKSTTGTTWYVQVGAFTNEALARKHLDRVKAAGFNAILKSSGGVLRVQVGAFSEKKLAEAQAAQVKLKGFNAIVTVTGGTVVSSGDSTPAVTDKTIKVGSKVRVRNGAKTYDGGSLASFVYNTTYDVQEINGTRVVIGLKGTVTAAMKISDLILQ